MDEGTRLAVEQTLRANQRHARRAGVALGDDGSGAREWRRRGVEVAPRPCFADRGARTVGSGGRCTTVERGRLRVVVAERLGYAWLMVELTSVEELQTAVASQDYLADRGLATAIYLALSLNKPLLLEGEAGVGKTEVAKVLSSLLGRRLIRLQCYEGIDASQALYEWNYSRQLIAVRAMDAADAETHVQDLFGPDFLVERPLLAAIREGSNAVLLVDELDRADDEFEAFLLEVLSEFAVQSRRSGAWRPRRRRRSSSRRTATVSCTTR